jgi:REP element-mobilizing transposase RayT
MPTESPHAHRLRRGRFSILGGVYLLTLVVEGRKPRFNSLTAGRLLVAELRAADAAGWATSLAWVVMPDHLHWLVRLETLSLSALMRNVKGRSARRLNQHLDLTGPFWQAGFHDRALREEEDLRLMARYIVANPIRAGLVERVGDYPLWDAIWL